MVKCEDIHNNARYVILLCYLYTIILKRCSKQLNTILIFAALRFEQATRCILPVQGTANYESMSISTPSYLLCLDSCRLSRSQWAALPLPAPQLRSVWLEQYQILLIFLSACNTGGARSDTTNCYHYCCHHRRLNWLIFF